MMSWRHEALLREQRLPEEMLAPSEKCEKVMG